MTRALIVVDVQNDFIAGTLPVPSGDQVAAEIADLVQNGGYDYVVTTQDWHIDPGEHFAAGREPDFIDTWPVHCVAGTDGAELSPRLDPILPMIDARFFKGEHSAAYSGFEGTTVMDDGRQAELAAWLSVQGVTDVDVCGLALDYCVKATALDAVKNGFTTRVLNTYTAPVSAAGGARAYVELAKNGCQLVGDEEGIAEAKATWIAEGAS